MGALTSHSLRGDDDPFRKTPTLDFPNFDHISKKQKVSQSAFHASGSAVHWFGQYPQPKEALPRAPHAPIKRILFPGGRFGSADGLGNSVSNSFSALKARYARASREALATVRHVVFGDEQLRDKEKGKEVIVVEDEDVTEGSSIEEMEIGNEKQVVHQRNITTAAVEKLVDGNRGLGNSPAPISSLKVNSDEMGLKFFSLSLESSKYSRRPHEVLLDSARKRDPKLKELDLQIQLKERLLQRHQLLRPQKKLDDVKEDVLKEPFIPLSDEDRSEISRALANSNRRKILVSHEKSNIDISGEMLQCLRPGAWLNDEVINVYLELLKERENREPQKFLKCHFLNTFFYKKLIGGKGGYNFQAVRRWTSQKKLGYYLSECDKIFVPIHKEIHWCLGVINKKEQKFQYLDSLGGRDDRVMKLLARYYVDEVKDKTGKEIDVSSWGYEFVKDLPEQKNGFDCGVFMIKYTDFYSRGVGLRFNQEHMPYFRQRTAKEILKLKAD